MLIGPLVCCYLGVTVLNVQKKLWYSLRGHERVTVLTVKKITNWDVVRDDINRGIFVENGE